MIKLTDLRLIDIKKMIIYYYRFSNTKKLDEFSIQEMFIVERNDNHIIGEIKLIHEKKYYYTFYLSKYYELRLSMKSFDSTIPLIPNSPIDYVRFLFYLEEKNKKNN